MRRLLYLLCGLLLTTTGVAQATNWPITYQLSGTLSGDYTTAADTVSFTDALFTLDVTAEATDVTAVVSTFDPSSPNDLYVVGAHPYHTGPVISGSLDIAGVGLFTFLNNLYASDSQWNNPYNGQFEFGTDAEFTFITVFDSFFDTYHMMTQVAPLPVGLWQVGFLPFAVNETTAGTTGALTLTNASSLVFQADGGVPEPSTFVLLGIGLAGMLVVRRKARN